MTKEEMRGAIVALPPLAGPLGGLVRIVNALVEQVPDAPVVPAVPRADESAEKPKRWKG